MHANMYVGRNCTTMLMDFQGDFLKTEADRDMWRTKLKSGQIRNSEKLKVRDFPIPNSVNTHWNDRS